MNSLALFALAFFIPTAGLPEDLRDYFRAKKPHVRANLKRRIFGDAPPIDAVKLANAIAAVQLWDARDAGLQELDLHDGPRSHNTKRAVIHMPPNYDPLRPWPLVITLHGQGQSSASMMQMTRRILGSAANEHIIIAPQDLGPLGFTEPSDVVNQPRGLLNSVRREFHIDNDRVFLMGYSLGSHNSWMAGVMHADCFAGIMPLATPLQLIGNDMLYDVLSPNLRNLETLFVWGAQDNLGQDGQPHPMGGNAEFSRRQAKAMREACGKRFIGVELPNAGHGDVRPPADEVKRWLSCKRQAWPKRIHQRFRLPEQSRAAWIQAEELMGQPLTDAQSKVTLKPGEDPLVAQKRHLIAQLGLIEASVDGQTITITTKKVKGVVLLLSDALLDLDKPVTIMRNKRQVYSGMIRRNREIVLRESDVTWDFARIPEARVVIPASGNKVTVGYSENLK